MYNVKIMSDKLTESQTKFCEEYIKNGYNASKAYRAAFKTDKATTANVNAPRLLEMKKIREEIERIEFNYATVGLQEGLDKRAIIRVIIKMMDATKQIFDKNGNMIAEVPDWIARNNGVALYAKLTGGFKEQKEITINETHSLGDVDVSKMTPEKREELKAAIMRDL
jgi:hypothetical protein